MADFDLFVIGGGSGGVACARRAGAYGAKVALCEPSRVGGTCVIRGCIPKKLMRYGATFADHLEAAPAYGWRLAAPAHDWRALIEARNTEIARLNGVYRRMLDDAGVTVMDGRGRVVASGAVEVNGESYTAKRILVAVGARPNVPALPGLELAITSDDALEHMEDRPGHVLVVGGGYIGVELATIFHALGVETTLVIRRTEPLRGFDRDVRAAATAEMKRRGLDIRTSTTIHHLERAGGLCCTRLPGRSRPIRCCTPPAASRFPIRAASGSRISACAWTSPALSASMRRTGAACPASTPSATAATMPGRGWTPAASISPRSRSRKAG